MGNTTSTFFPSNQTATTSFQQQQSSASGQRRVGPVMGNRGLESQRISQQDRSRTKTKMGGQSNNKESSRSRGSPRSSRKVAAETVAGTNFFLKVLDYF